MKKLLSLALAGALLAALALPAAAAEDNAGVRLARVTQLVKDRLELDTEAYENFSGDYSEELYVRWSLNWSGEENGLYVEALEDGSILSYQAEEPEINDSSRLDGSFPSFPDGDESACRESAETFLQKVLREDESVELETPSGMNGLWRKTYVYRGKILLDGLSSPLNCYISLDAVTGRVIRFWRDYPETVAVGGVPASQAAVAQDQASAALRETLELRLEYVLGTKDSTTARLRYIPEQGDTIYIDAQTGALVNLTELEELLDNVKNYDMDVSAPMNTAMGKESGESSNDGLSAAEQSGVKDMEGVLPQEKLDALVRAEEAYGLQGYALASASYTAEKGEDGTAAEVRCVLRYRKTDGEDVYTRNFTVDARTGEVQRVNSSMPWERERVLTEEQAAEKAAAFLKSFCPDRAESLERYMPSAYKPLEDAPYYSFQFAQKENGYFFPENMYRIAIDAVNGAVYSLSYDWSDDITFDSPEDIISMEEAIDAWMATYDTALAYRLVPQELDAADPVQARLIEQKQTHYYGMRLTYGLEQAEYCAGIDAKTGNGEYQEDEAEDVPGYQDLSGSSAKEDIEKLAQYGIGYQTEAFRPGKSLTQWDLVCLLASLRGWRMDPETDVKEERDSAYYNAYSMGVLTRSERSDNAAVNRGTLVRMLLNAAGYGPAARLEKIYTCTYADRESIAAADIGYAAIAQALGLAEGTYGGARTATRGEAASMLCRLLERPS